MSTEKLSEKRVSIGVLALQGAFKEHIYMFNKIPGVQTVEVRLPEDLDKIDGLVIPGGESTTISSVAERWGLTEPLKLWVSNKKPTWGTCAGMILLSRSVTGKMKDGQVVLGGLDTTVHRNYFGSQLGSFVATIDAKGLNSTSAATSTCRGVFIRAPVIVEHTGDVQVLATVQMPTKWSSEAAWDGEDDKSAIVAVRQQSILATSFHPELTDDLRWHEEFVNLVRENLSGEDNNANLD